MSWIKLTQLFQKFVELDFDNLDDCKLMWPINKAVQKRNQMLVMDVLREFHDIDDTIDVHFWNDVVEVQKWILKQDKQLLNDNDYHLINLVELYNNYLVNLSSFIF